MRKNFIISWTPKVNYSAPKAHHPTGP